jgi:hypothetical protein
MYKFHNVIVRKKLSDSLEGYPLTRVKGSPVSFVAGDASLVEGHVINLRFTTPSGDVTEVPVRIAQVTEVDRFICINPINGNPEGTLAVTRRAWENLWDGLFTPATATTEA